MNIADWVVLIVLGAFALRGFFRGFVISVIRTFSLFISLFLAKLFHIQAANLILTAFPGVRNSIYEGVRDFVVHSLPNGGGGGIDFVSLLNGIAPEIARSIPPNLDIGDALVQSTPQMNSIIDMLTAHISTFVINCIAFVIVFAVVSVSIEIMIAGVKIFRKLPVIGAFDSLLGAALGLVQGWLVLSVVFFIVLNMNHAGMMKEFAIQIENSMFAKIWMNYDLIGGMVKGLMEITAWAF